MRVSLKPVTHRLLADRTFDIEFNGFLSNHAKHAVVALQGLDAPESRIEGYWNEYTAVTPYGSQLHRIADSWDDRVDALQSRHDFVALRGKKTDWQSQVAFLDRTLASDQYQSSTNKLVAEYADDDNLMDGIAGALTHGVIHLGWGIDANSPPMITEGLAYLNFAHIGVNADVFNHAAHDESTPMESFLRVSETFTRQDLVQTWVDPVKAKYDESFHPELVVAGFQWEVAKLLHEPHAVVTNLPSWIDGKAADQEDTWANLYRAITYLFLASRDENGHGNFVVLHLITSLWAIEQVCRVVEKEKGSDAGARVRRRAWSQFYASTVVFFGAARGFPSTGALKAVQSSFSPERKDDESYDWTQTVEAGIAEVEEHNIKLVYVMRELWSRYGRWTGFSEAAKSFTLTPSISGAFTNDE